MTNALSQTPGGKLLSVADFEKPINNILVEVAKRVEKVDLAFDAYRFDGLLEEVGQILDRCVVIRRECQDLYATATRRALEFNLFEEQKSPLKQLELDESLISQRQAEYDGQIAAAAAFAEADVSDKVAKGMQALAAGNASSSKTSIESLKTRQSNIENKWKALATQQEELFKRHSADGGSLNYGQRYSYLREQLREDFELGYSKARSASAGLLLTFSHNSFALPPVDSSVTKPILEGIIDWHRRATRTLELFRSREVDFEVIAPIRKNYPDDKGWATAIYDQMLEVDLSEYLQLPALRLRCIGIGLSISLKVDPLDANLRLFRASGVVFPPPVADPSSASSDSTGGSSTTGTPAAAKEVLRAPIILSNICLTEPNSPPPLVSSQAVRNISPRGVWKIKLNRRIWSPVEPDSIERLNYNVVSDVKLHLHLIGELEADPTRWNANFPW